MRILALRGQNLASLKGRFEIDLCAPPLGALGLFAIAGPVGAGKSTLLDALCLALFGRTPRLSGRGGALLGDAKDGVRANDPRMLVRRGAALAFAEVDFVGQDGGRYRARWQVRRARGQAFGRLLGEEHTLTCLQTDRLLTEQPTASKLAVAERLGLSFEEMCRSVVLSQGGFSAFLQAKPHERAELLERMTGTEIYGVLSQRAFGRAKNAQIELTVLEAERAPLAPLAAAARAALVTQTDAARQERTALEDRVVALAMAVEQAAERARREEALSVARAAVVVQTAKLAEVEQARAALVAERARRGPALAEGEWIVAALEATDVDAASAAAEHANGQLSTLTEAHLRLVADLERAEAIERSVRTQLTPALEALAQQAPALRLQLERWDVLLKELSATRALGEAFARNAAALRGTLEARAADEGARRDALALARAALPEGIAAIDARVARAALLASVATATHARCIELAAELRGEERALARFEHAAARATLAPGDPCPLCGATDHPFTRQPELPLVAGQLEAVAALRAEVERLVREEAAIRARVDEIDAASASDAEQRALERVSPDHAADVADRLLQVIECEQALTVCQGTRAEAGDLLDDAMTQHAFACREIESRAAELAALVARILPAFDAVESRVQTGPDADDPRALARALQRQVASHQSATGALAAARAERVRLEPLCAEAARTLHVAQGRAQEAATVLARVRAEREALQQRLRAVMGQDDPRVVGRRLTEAEASAERALRDSSATLAAAMAAEQAAIAELARLIGPSHGAKLAESPEPEALAAARAGLSRLDEALGSHVAALARDDDVRARVAALDARLSERRASAAVWTELAELIGSSDGGRFRTFAQSLTLDTLVQQANVHLDMLAPRYRLERLPSARVGVELELCVVDRESGDERRGVQSLSGGETFLVSLALALGLASLSAPRVKVESLFIDEGFSSLDPDTLEIALAAFDALRSTGRQIGVISHVPALAERIGSQVRVTPIGEGRSRVDVRAG